MMNASDEQLDLFDGNDAVEFTALPSEDDVDVADQARFREAVLHATDWTTETIISQLSRGNIVLNPSFQRRDAWKLPQKSRFIESLLMGLPIPQIVLAETKSHRGKFIVLDGKQRLLSILQFWGLGSGANNEYALSGLNIRKDLCRMKFKVLESDPERQEDLNALLNQPIRTVVIKNWPDEDFLHLVFLRLNTGSVKLSPQELRQALFPGQFSDWVDEAAVNSAGIKNLLKLNEPDYRMRDIEILARYLTFSFHLTDYRGRMKTSLDKFFKMCNEDWPTWEPQVNRALEDFELAVISLTEIFGDQVGRKPESRHFNRAVFDFLIFYARNKNVRSAMLNHADELKNNFTKLFDNHTFKSATERDTAGVPNTVLRLAEWGKVIARTTGITVPIPKIRETEGEQRIEF